jgi:hypothetical protein
MVKNSPEPAHSGFDQARVINELRQWLEREGGNQRIPQVLDLLAGHTARSWASGLPSPAVDADTLRLLHRDAHGGVEQDAPASKWLKRREVQQWWAFRREAIEQVFRSRQMDAAPALTILSGGGRGNPTQYRLDLVPLPSRNDEAESPSDTTAPNAVGYQSEPATPVWWLRPILGRAPFRMRSVRGYLLIGLVLAEALALLLAGLLALLSLSYARPISTVDVATLLVLGFAGWTWWHFMQPIIRLPTERITAANDLLLGWSQMNGQFRLVRDAHSKRLGGWFQLERHHGTCPLCSGEVDVFDGGKAFPGRLIGRCGDSPIEHVFSFDPVSRTGHPLYRQAIST